MIATVLRPRAVLFDWDNTLVDSWATIEDALNVTLTAFGHAPWSPDEVKRRVRKSMRDSFPRLFGDRWEEAGKVFYARYEEIHVTKLTPLEGAAEMLAELAASGLYLAVISNKKGEFLRREADHLGWSRHFGRLVGALDAARDKPAIEPVLMALDGSGIKPGTDVWIAGDADIDLECAQNATCTPILLREYPPEEGEFPSHPPVRYFSGCRALSSAFKSM
ncbi:MAG: HAD family hydrolase [Alphaproteobacteria bacterium]|nr:HAD family hydrolase [Alphaproteobacteria bacterium]